MHVLQENADKHGINEWSRLITNGVMENYTSNQPNLKLNIKKYFKYVSCFTCLLINYWKPMSYEIFIGQTPSTLHVLWQIQCRWTRDLFTASIIATIRFHIRFEGQRTKGSCGRNAIDRWCGQSLITLLIKDEQHLEIAKRKYSHMT